MTASTQWQLAQEAAERYDGILVPVILGPFAKARVDRDDTALPRRHAFPSVHTW